MDVIKAPLQFAKSKPVTTALVVVGGGALLWFAFGGSPAGAGESEEYSAYDAATAAYWAGPSDAQIAAGSQLAMAQGEQANQRYIAELGAETTLAARVSQERETLAALQADDAKDARAVSGTISLASIESNLRQALAGGELAGLRDNNATAVQLRAIQSSEAQSLANISASTQNYQTQQAASAQKRESNNGLLGSIIGGGLSLLTKFI